MKDADRIPRAVLQQRLEKILARVDATPEFRGEWRGPSWLGGKLETGAFKVSRVYVVGSFARGATECGDLDLLVTIEPTGGIGPPPSRAVSRIVGRSAHHVQVHVGTPEDNSSLAKFPDAKLVWSPRSRNWVRNLDAIKVDPRAGRFARPTDSLPLRLPQMRMHDLAVAEEVVRLIAERKLESEWRPVTQIRVDQSSWDADTSKLFTRMCAEAGKQTRSVLPYVFQYLSETNARPKRSFLLDPTDFPFGPIRVRVGLPLLDVSPLEEVGTDVIVMAPHLTGRGPKGLWILRRGKAHRARGLFQGLSFWALADKDNRVLVIQVHEREHDWGSPDYFAVDLFTSARKARKARLDEDEYPVAFDGYRVLDAIGSADVLNLDDHSVALTPWGAPFHEKLPSQDWNALAQWLKERAALPALRRRRP